MLILILVLVAYLFGVNFYAFLLIKSMRKEEAELAQPLQNETEQPTKSAKKGDGRLALTGLLGGALTIYACMFAMKYKLKNMFLMIIMPVLAVLNIYLVFIVARYGFLNFRF